MTAPMTDTVVKIADLMTSIIVDVVDPVTDILVRAASLRTGVIGRGADLVTVLIVTVITPTTDIAKSRVVPARQLNAQMTAYQSMRKFGHADPPKLTKNTLESVAVDIFIKVSPSVATGGCF
jgi:hypothetical protein